MTIPMVEWNQREAIQQEDAPPVQSQTVFMRLIRFSVFIAMLGFMGIMLRLAS